MTASIDVNKTLVYIDGVLRRDARVQRVSQSVGGAVADYAEFYLQPHHSVAPTGIQNRNIVDLAINSTCEILVNNEFRQLRPIHFGRVFAAEPVISGDQDQVKYTSRFEDHLFGDVYVTRRDQTFPGLLETRIDEYSVFNPEVEDEVQPNMTFSRRSGWPVFIDPKSLPHQTEKPDLAAYRRLALHSPALAAVPRFYWSLFDAVVYLCRELNARARYIAGPRLPDLFSELYGDGTDRRQPHLRNHRVRLGEHLPRLLDDLLHPFGFSWHIQYVAYGNRRIRVFRRGRSRVFSTTWLQRAGSVIDRRFSRKEINLQVDTASRATNAVLVLGDWEQMEATFLLEPGWHQRYDGTDPSTLRKDDETVLSDPWKERIWNTWVLNEGGDYVHPFWRRPQRLMPGTLWATGFPLHQYFGHGGYIPRRRRFEPTLTGRIDGRPWAHPFLEYSLDHLNVQPDVRKWKWNPVENLEDVTGVRPLPSECGVRVMTNSGKPPIDFLGQVPGETLHLRATATIRSDTRIRGFWYTRTSRLSDLRPLLIERRDLKYKWINLNPLAGTRVLDGASTLGRRLSERKTINPQTGERVRMIGNRGATANIQDDRLRIVWFARRVAEAWNTATIHGTIKLEGVSADYCGAPLRWIRGRNLSLNVAPPGFPPSYPDVLRADYTFGESTVDTTLSLESYKDPVTQ